MSGRRRDHGPQGGPAVRGCLVAVLIVVAFVALVGLLIVAVTAGAGQ